MHCVQKFLNGYNKHIIWVIKTLLWLQDEDDDDQDEDEDEDEDDEEDDSDEEEVILVDIKKSLRFTFNLIVQQFRICLKSCCSFT